MAVQSKGVVQRRAPDPVRRRCLAAAPGRSPSRRAGRALLALVVVGVALRVLSIVSLFPTTILEDGYQKYAKTNPFLDPLHPAGYSLILAAIGGITHLIIATVVLQHLLGIVAALTLWAATRRVTGSEWAGLLPAGIVLLNGDEVFLEHSIMSESWEVLAIALGLYSAVRTLDQPRPWTRWPLRTGIALGAAVAIRDASMMLIAVTILALLVGRPGAVGSWRNRWRAPLAVAGAAGVMLLVYAGANAQFAGRFAMTPSTSWYLYGRVAQFANCDRFTPPPGTDGLCQTIPPSQRPSAYDYMFVEQHSPALRLYGGFGRDGDLVGAWAERALRAQVGDFLKTGWAYLRSYYVPGSLPPRLKGSTGLDPQLDFTYVGNVFYVAAGLEALQDFFDRFTIHRVGWGLRIIRDWQVVIRFGATALFVTTLLTLLGLLIGTRRSRFGVLLFGVGGVALLAVPALTSTYSGRYTVPMAGPLAAAAAITITEIRRGVARRRARPSIPPADPDP
jgi:Dolichyl-phosphate-mannose-protein mannosyltransferase